MLIQVIDFPVYMKIGYRSVERLEAQNVLVSLDVNVDNDADPGLSDDLGRALDYGLLAGMIDEQLNGRECRLIETAVNLVGEAIMRANPRIKDCTVTVEKTSLPQSIMKTARVRVNKRFFQVAGG
jgi:dihydroneopterin aldolase